MNILYMPVKGIDFVSGYDFQSDSEIIPTTWYFGFSFYFMQHIFNYLATLLGIYDVLYML